MSLKTPKKDISRAYILEPGPPFCFVAPTVPTMCPNFLSNKEAKGVLLSLERTWKWMAPPVCSGFHRLPCGGILHFHVSSRECMGGQRSSIQGVFQRICLQPTRPLSTGIPVPWSGRAQAARPPLTCKGFGKATCYGRIAETSPRH